MRVERFTLGEGEVLYIPDWSSDPDAMLEEAKKLSFTEERIPSWTDPKVPVAIKKRMTADYGLAYAYGKFAKPSIPWEPFAVEVQQRLEKQFSLKLPQCACNLYKDHEGYIGPHVDKWTPIEGVKYEPRMIMSLSLGAVRKMMFLPLHYEKGKRSVGTTANALQPYSALTLDLAPGSLVVFSNAINQNFKHTIPQQTKKEVGDGMRISLTYRQF